MGGTDGEYRQGQSYHRATEENTGKGVGMAGISMQKLLKRKDGIDIIKIEIFALLIFFRCRKERQYE